MSSDTALHPSKQSMNILSRLVIASRKDDALPALVGGDDTGSDLINITRADFEELLSLANSNHVVMRGLDALLARMRLREDALRAEWVSSAMETERARITNALSYLSAICAAFETDGHDVMVIKSLDHWPDIGSDLDLYTNADPEVICELMRQRFQAEIAPRSWGDRLACKWNFVIPGLSEAVEVHMGRLGQTGEQVVLASRLMQRSRWIEVEGHRFRVASASDRLMISTLQRMYRHFYFRLCDIVDTATLSASGVIDYNDLKLAAEEAGIWEGVATYLVIVSDYIKQYGGPGLDLPQSVTATARFGGDRVYFGNSFLRVPIIPQSVGLYRSQLAGLLLKRELQSSARLGLLPWLATAAVIGQKITGSDKGIW